MDTGKQVIKGAKELATRLTNTLAPLFSYLNSTWPGMERHIWKIFKHALKIKVDFGLEAEHYTVLY